MCLAIPGKITSIEGQKATIHYPGNQTRYAMIGLPNLQVGDNVMVQMGVIVKKLSPEEAQMSTQAWQASP